MVGLDGRERALKDIKGLHHIQLLLQHPDQESYVFDTLREPPSPEAWKRRAMKPLYLQTLQSKWAVWAMRARCSMRRPGRVSAPTN